MDKPQKVSGADGRFWSHSCSILNVHDNKLVFGLTNKQDPILKSR